MLKRFVLYINISDHSVDTILHSTILIFSIISISTWHVIFLVAYLLSIPPSFHYQKLSFIGSRQYAQPSDKSWLIWTNHDKPVPFFPSLPCSRRWDHVTQFWECNLRDDTLGGEGCFWEGIHFLDKCNRLLAFPLSLFFLP